MVADFQRYVGIDYSGRDEPTGGNPAILVYEASAAADPVAVRPVEARDWSRAALAAWLVEQMKSCQRLIVGIDHAFSLPREKMGNGATWNDFLIAFREVWRTDARPVTKVAIAQAYPDCGKLLRLTEQWTSSAKSAFDCNGQPRLALFDNLAQAIQKVSMSLNLAGRTGDRGIFW